MRYRKLGTTGMDVSSVGVGTWAISGTRWGPPDEREAIVGLQLAVDLGATLFDTVDVFGDGHGEEVLGEALRGRRHLVHIVTKGGVDFTRRPHQQDFTPAYLERALGQSLRRLRTDYVDVYMLHSPPVDVLRDPAVYDLLDSLRNAGRLIAYGVSSSTVEEAKAAIAARRISCLMVPYNILDQEMAADVLPAAEQAGIAVVVRAPLALGLLADTLTSATVFHPVDFRASWDRPSYLRRIEKRERIRWLIHDDIRSLPQAAIAFTLSNPAVTAAVPGFRTTAQIAENLSAGDLFPLPDEDLAELATMYEDDFGFALPTYDGNPWDSL